MTARATPPAPSRAPPRAPRPAPPRGVIGVGNLVHVQIYHQDTIQTVFMLCRSRSHGDVVEHAETLSAVPKRMVCPPCTRTGPRMAAGGSQSAQQLMNAPSPPPQAHRDTDNLDDRQMWEAGTPRGRLLFCGDGIIVSKRTSQQDNPLQQTAGTGVHISLHQTQRVWVIPARLAALGRL